MKNLLIIMLLAVILAMAVPLTVYKAQNETAFTYDNVINIYPSER